MIQGGAMTEDEATTFEQTPFHADAVRLRRWDDLAKQPGMRT
jgi:[1-hydroxy-2-(trimethylamino)ethyl]phosphonate dioxygenase